MQPVSLEQKAPYATTIPLTHFLVNGKEIAEQVMVGRGLQKCADFTKENFHAFYWSCPKPEACLRFSTVESLYFQKICHKVETNELFSSHLWLFLDFIIHNSHLG